MECETKISIVEKGEVEKFIMECMLKLGTDPKHAFQLAEVLVAADYRGHYSHGLNRLEMYVKDMQSNLCEKHGEPVILHEKASTAWVDGKNLLGPVVGNFCMDLAVKKAQQTGIGWVVSKSSNHYGIAGWYSLRACANGLIGMSFTNTSALAQPTRSKKVALGANPLALTAPGNNGDNFCLDMATTTVALGKIEMADRKGLPLCRGWGANADGQETLDPKDVLRNGSLLPLGGMEETGGYKGYGLGMLVEIFCGISGDSHWGPNIRHWQHPDTKADLGQCFIAIDPSGFAPGFSDRLQCMLDTFRSLPRADDGLPVLIPGDRAQAHMKECDQSGGIPYHPSLISQAENLAKKMGVKPMRIKQ